MARGKALGRGLSALIGEGQSERGDESRVGGMPLALALAKIQASRFQPRRQFAESELEELSESIRRHGVLQPIVVRLFEDGYELIAGERRVRAAKMAGLESIPGWVRDASDEEMIALALIENIQREDLNPLEEAVAFGRLAEELGWTQEQIAVEVGKSRSHVANYMRLLQLDERIQGWILSTQLTMAHAKVLLSEEDEGVRLRLAEAAVVGQWTVRELDRRRRTSAVVRVPVSKELDVHMRQVEQGLCRALGAGVRVRGDGKKGKIEIRYRSLEELERLLEVLRRSDEVTGGFPV